MKFVVSTKEGKSYSAASETDLFVGNKISDTVKLDQIGLTGYEAMITGGSDKQGFPMNTSVQGQNRKRIFSGKTPGFKPTRKGERKRFTVRGNTIGPEVSMVNLVITKKGTVEIGDVLKSKEPAPEEKMSAKELAIKKSLEMAGSKELDAAPTKKVRH
jgi:small subunit ribosomal protein S6e